MRIELARSYDYIEMATAGLELFERIQQSEINGTDFWSRFKPHFLDHILGKRIDNIILPAEGFSLCFLRAEDLIYSDVPLKKVLGFNPQFVFQLDEKIDQETSEFLSEVKATVSRNYKLENIDNPNSLVFPNKIYGKGVIEIFNPNLGETSED